MPSSRIDSWQSSYDRISRADKKDISTEISRVVAEFMLEDRAGIETRWNAPFDEEISDNTCQYSVDLTFSMSRTKPTLEALAKQVLKVFELSPAIISGEEYGVWITTPGDYVWKSGIKP